MLQISTLIPYDLNTELNKAGDLALGKYNFILSDLSPFTSDRRQ